jgi:hypothetical protein
MSKNQNGENGHHPKRRPDQPSVGSRNNEQTDKREYVKPETDQDMSDQGPEEERAKLSIVTDDNTVQNDDKEVDGDLADAESGNSTAVFEVNMDNEGGGHTYDSEYENFDEEEIIDDDDNEEGDAERERRMRKKNPPEND